MTRARSALLPSCAIIAALLLPSSDVGRDQADPLRRPGDVVVFIVDRVSFEELLSEQRFHQIASSGGVALMATPPDDRSQPNVYRALGSGAGSSAGADQLLSRILDREGISVCVREPGGFLLRPPGPNSPLRFLGLGPTGDDACREDSLASEGAVLFISTGFTARADRPGSSTAQRAGDRKQALDSDGTFLEGAVGRGPVPGRSLVIVLTPTPSIDMQAAGDEVTPVVMAEGTNLTIFGRSGSPRTLRSDTTRQPGLVSNVDLAPTILDFFGIPIPDEMTGSPIHVDGARDVAALHRIHLDQRRIRLPLQLAEIAFVAFLGILAIPMLVWLGLGRILPSWMANGMRYLCVCGAALTIPLMAGGLLPRLTYPIVVPFVVLSVAGLAALASRWPGRLGPFAFIGAVGLAFIVVDALFGWRGLRVPLLGGTMFDGVRFYGLPNVFIPTLLASVLFVAILLPPWPGTLLLLGAGLFAGFPALGANLGAAVTLFVATGLWWVIRAGRPFSIRDLMLIAGVVAVGTAVVLLANRYLPGAPTHIAGFVERTRGGLAGVWDAFTSRVEIGVGQIRDVPAAWIPLVGLPVVLATALIRPEPVRSGLEMAGGVWRDVLIVLTISGMAAFLANDTGVAAAAPAFLFAATGMAYPVFLRAARR